MSYDNPIYITTEIDLAANQDDASWKIRGPSGKRGRLIEAMFSATATTALGASAVLNVGTAGTAAAFGTLTIATDLTAGTVKRASADGTVTSTISVADTDVVIAVDTSVNTDDIAGIFTVTMAWW